MLSARAIFWDSMRTKLTVSRTPTRALDKLLGLPAVFPQIRLIFLMVASLRTLNMLLMATSSLISLKILWLLYPTAWFPHMLNTLLTATCSISSLKVLKATTGGFGRPRLGSFPSHLRAPIRIHCSQLRVESS